MLASAGFLVQEKYHPLFTADGGPAIEQIPQLPVFMWFAMTLGIGIAEGYRVNVGWTNPKAPDHFFQKLEDDCEPSHAAAHGVLLTRGENCQQRERPSSAV
eukprot:3754526-Pleurochrysis_carterae.AAC.1